MLFSEFTGQYPLSKTLRFELIPQGKTEYWIEKMVCLHLMQKSTGLSRCEENY